MRLRKAMEVMWQSLTPPPLLWSPPSRLSWESECCIGFLAFFFSAAAARYDEDDDDEDGLEVERGQQQQQQQQQHSCKVEGRQNGKKKQQKFVLNC